MLLAVKYSLVAAATLGCLGMVSTLLTGAPAAPAEAAASPVVAAVQNAPVTVELAAAPADLRIDEITRSTERQQLVPATADLAAKRQTELVATNKRIKARIAKLEAAHQALIRELGYEPGTTDPRDIARQMMKNKYGWGESQFQCYDRIIMRESKWLWYADNPHSSAYGIPQALPGSKMASAGADWRTNPATQIKWGLGYVKARYGTPCGAWGFKRSHGWY